MKLIFYLSIFLLVLSSCDQPKKEASSPPQKDVLEEKSDKFFQYSIWWAFVNKVFDGDLKVRALKSHGDIGLGSFDMLDGEMVMVDGIPYRIRENGEISVGKDDDEIVYANATFFDKDGSFTAKSSSSYKEFQNQLDSFMPNDKYFYAYKVHGTFKYIKLGGVPKVEKPFKDGLDVLLPIRPVFEGENITGTLIGFYCPTFIGNINAYGYHFHFIADDLKLGGHAMDFVSESDLTIDFDEMHEYQFQLPQNETYEKVKLEKAFQYN